MEKFVKYFMLLVPVLFCLNASGAKGENPVIPVVCRVEVECSQGAVRQSRCYTQDEKMRWVLNFLRMHKNLGIPEEDPETAAGDCYTVSVYLSNGQKRVYRQQADRYLRKNGRWQKVDPGWAGCFYFLLQTLPGDEI